MSTKTTLVLVLILIVLGGFYLYSPDRKTEQAKEEATKLNASTDSSRVFAKDISLEDIQTITVSPNDGQSMTFTRQSTIGGPNKWRMTAPTEASTETWQVDNLARLLAELKFTVSFKVNDENAPTPADAGLEPANLIVSFTTEDDEFTLSVGKNVALGTGTYVAQGEQYYITADDLNERIKTQLSDYRAKNVMHFATHKATQLEITHDGIAYGFSKNDEGQWIITEPVQAFAQEAELGSLLKNLARLRAVTFFDQDASEPAYGFDEPLLTARVTFEEEPSPASTDPNASAQVTAVEVTAVEVTVPQITERQIELAIGSPADLEKVNRFARLPNEPGFFTLPQNAIDNLRPQLSKLRDNAVTNLNPDQLTSMTISDATGTLKVTRGEDGWSADSEFGAIDPYAIQEWTEAFANLKAVGFLDSPKDLSDYGLAEPRATVTALQSDSPEPIRIMIGIQSGSGVNAFIKRADQKTVYVVTAESADALAIDPIMLSSREIFNFIPHQLAQLSLRRDQMSYLFSQTPEGIWSLLAPEAAKENMPNFFGMVTDLTRLRARRVLNPALFDIDPNLPNADLTLSLQLRPRSKDESEPQPVEQHTLRVKDTGAQVLASLNDKPVLFELDRTVFDTFNNEMIATQVFDFAADQVSSYRVTNPNFKLHLNKTDTGWSEASDEFITIDSAKVAETLSALASLQVERYFAYANADLSRYESPLATRIEITHSENQTATLLLTGIDQPVAWIETGRTFRLPILEVEKLLKELSYYAVLPANE